MIDYIHTMSLTNALETYTPTNTGEKGHLQYDWSNNLDEKIVQFHFQLVRTTNHSKLEEQLHIILSTLKASVEKSQYLSKLTLVYKLIGHTRDILKGKGEQQLSFMQILIWYEYFPELAFNAFTHLVKIDNAHPYGSWKDVKYFCNFVKEKCQCMPKHALTHPLVIHAIKLLVSQLSFIDSPLLVDLYYKDTLVHSDKISGRQFLTRIYQLSKFRRGRYTVVMHSNTRKYVKNLYL